MPIVVMNVGENESLAYLSSRQVLPTPKRKFYCKTTVQIDEIVVTTPESPIISSLICISKALSLPAI
jgi:hypothetical protein